MSALKIVPGESAPGFVNFNFGKSPCLYLSYMISRGVRHGRRAEVGQELALYFLFETVCELWFCNFDRL